MLFVVLELKLRILPMIDKYSTSGCTQPSKLLYRGFVCKGRKTQPLLKKRHLLILASKAHIETNTKTRIIIHARRDVDCLWFYNPSFYFHVPALRFPIVFSNTLKSSLKVLASTSSDIIRVQ